MLCSAALFGALVGRSDAEAPPAFTGSAKDFVSQYDADLTAFGKDYNAKKVVLSDAVVTGVTLPDAKSGAPWLITLRDDTGAGTPANVSCFVASTLSAADKKRALAVKKNAHVTLSAVVAADGYSLGLTKCVIVAPQTAAAPRANASASVAQTTATAPPAVAAPPITFTVTKAWNDSVNGVLFVHDAITIAGGERDVELPPDAFALGMSLANGAKKSYTSLTQAAPTYAKYSPGAPNNTMTAYEVAPREDLGSIGTLTIPAHGNVRVIVTFQVVDEVADPTNNRNVTLK